jgi:hypothetical protein
MIEELETIAYLEVSVVSVANTTVKSVRLDLAMKMVPFFRKRDTLAFLSM